MHIETCWKEYPLNLLIKKEIIYLKRAKYLHQHLHLCNRKLYLHNALLNVGGESRENPIKEGDNSILEVTYLLDIKP